MVIFIGIPPPELQIGNFLTPDGNHEIDRIKQKMHLRLRAVNWLNKIESKILKLSVLSLTIN
jgi:hypothetical protein